MAAGAWSSTCRRRQGSGAAGSAWTCCRARVVRVAVDAQLTTDMPDAVMEHQLGEVVPGWLTGRPIEATDARGAVVRKIVPGAAKSDDTKKNILATGFRRLTLDTRVGKVDIVTSGNAPLTLIDHRRNPYAMGKMVFWFGVFDIPVKPWERLSYEVEYRFPPPAKSAPAPAAQVTEKPRAVHAALRPQSVPDRVIPTPKKIDWRRGDLSLAAGATVSVNADGTAEKAFAEGIAAQLREDLESRHGVCPPAAGAPGAEIELRIAPSARGGASHGPEEYRVEVGARAVLEAQTTAGLANAWKTLRQLGRSGDGSPARIRRCTVHDWPSLDFRGILFFTGRDAGDDQAKLVRDILGAMKVNFLLYHVNMAQWDSHPELHSKSLGMSRDEVRKVIDECRRQQVEIIPFVPAFGIKEWIRFGDMPHPDAGQHLKFKPLDAAELRTVHDIMREAAELFQPRYFHIGHDELDTTTGQLLESIRIHRDFLATLGLRTMIWSDLLLYRGEGTDAMNAPSPVAARQRREGLPKDVIVTDWHYDPADQDKYKSLAIFNDAGLDTIACPWDNPRNIVQITREALRLKCGAGEHEIPGPLPRMLHGDARHHMGGMELRPQGDGGERQAGGGMDRRGRGRVDRR